MKNPDSIARKLLQRKQHEPVLLPVFRFWLFQMVLVVIGITAINLVLNGGISLIEIVYVLLAVGAITFVILFGTYYMIGALHGRLGFERSIGKPIAIAMGTGCLFGAACLIGNRLNGDALPAAYLVAVAILFPCLQLGYAYWFGEMAIKGVETVAGSAQPAKNQDSSGKT